MQTFLVILLILAMIATVVALVRGIVIFLKTTEQDLLGTGVSNSGVRQNKAMRQRIMFQALAVVVIVLILISTRG
ncbi:twin transmembrane helix small protein [Sphingomonas sp. ID0503]|uniref:twin transmembrane helix small protein n=1 Tax=Sphingomonas sp. ID0503 TaxID=3399691 RepID=UPI003AFA1C97